MILRRLFQFQFIIPLLAVAARLLPGPRTIDDAYITFRYAQNLLGGYGLVYNPGDWVLGTTTPGYALLLSLIGFFSGGSEASFPVQAWLLNSLLDGLNAFLLLRIGTQLGSPRSGVLASLIWAIAPWSVTFAVGGMETSLAVATLLGTLYLYLDHKPVMSVALAGFGVLVRPDTLLFSGILIVIRLAAIDPTLRKRLDQVRPTSKELVAFGVPLAAWGLIATFLYGHPLPNSLFAKAVAYQLAPEESLVRFLQHYGTLFLGHLHFGTWWLALGILLYPSLFLLAAIRHLKQSSFSLPLFLFPWVYFIAYVAANPLVFRWYLTPPIPFLLLGVFLGLEQVSQDLNFKPLPLIAGLLAFTSTLLGWQVHPDHGADRPSPQMAFTKLELLYEQVARDLRQDLTSGQVLAAGDVGALGYFSEARILDTVGLISPQSISYYPLPESAYAGINYAIPAQLILDESPDFLVILEVYGRNTLLGDPEFNTSFKLYRVYPTDLYGSQGMLVFRKITR